MNMFEDSEILSQEILLNFDAVCFSKKTCQTNLISFKIEFDGDLILYNLQLMVQHKHF